MQTPHVDENTLDLYVTGTLEEDSVRVVEEHLLECPLCQRRLKAADEFVAVFRTAAGELRQPRMAVSRRGAWWGLAAAALLLLGIAISRQTYIDRQTPATVVMQAFRGPETGARIAAGTPGLLVFDAKPLSGSPREEVQLVDA